MTWKLEHLGVLCEVVTKGTTPTTYGHQFQSSGINFIKIESITSDGELIPERFSYVTPECHDEQARSQLQENDILFSIAGALGRAAIVRKEHLPANTNQALAIIRLKREAGIDPRYLLKLLASSVVVEQTERMGAGAAQQNLSLAQVKQLSIPVPPLPEQQRIVTKLDAAFGALREAEGHVERNRANARELFESYLNGVFEGKGDGWRSMQLQDIAKFIDYRGRTPDKTSSGLRLITAKNVRKGHLNREPEEFVAADSYETWMTRGIPEYGDVLFTTEAPLANVAQLDTRERVVFAQRIIILQPKKELVDETFLKYALLSGPMQAMILSKGTGATVSGIKASLLKLIEVPFPTMNEQKAIVGRLEAIEARSRELEATYQQKLRELEGLKKGLLGAAFRGEL